jgi:hypothetical protein
VAETVKKTVAEAVEKAVAEAVEKTRQATEEAKGDGKLQSHRDILKMLLQDKFTRLPKKLLKQIDAAEDVDQLRGAIRRVRGCENLADFQL